MLQGNYNVNVTPRFQVLSVDQVEEMHYGTLEVLRRTGVKVLVAEARDMLKKAGCWADGEVVHFPLHLVEWALRTAPSRVELCDRAGRPAMSLEGAKTYFGTGSDCPNVIDPYTGQRRRGRLEDVVNFARLVDGLPNIDFHMCMAIAQDIEQATADIHHFETMLNHTTKPLCYTAWNLDNLKDIVAMCEAVAGGAEAFRQNPFAILYTEPVSPLQHIVEGTSKLMYMARKGLPVVYTPGMSFGAVAPITSAGGLLVANAELLSGLVIAQLAASSGRSAGEGIPFVYGGGVAIMDMRHMNVSYAAPEFWINMAALCDLARHYRLPVFSFGGCSDSKTFDQQASLEGALWILVTALAGGNLSHDVGYIEYGLTASMELTVMNDEIIGWVRRALSGVEVSQETLALDVIDRVGPGGHFLEEEHTLKHFRENWYPTLLNRTAYATWLEQGGLTYGELANRRVRHILESHQPPPLPEDVRAALRAIVQQADARYGGLDEWKAG
jgi:trimethylamine--corrinoid protein Co-methyltransferase